MQSLDSYNLIDLFIIGTLLVTIILGTWKGFVRSLTALAGLVLGIILAGRYYSLIEPYLNKISSLDRNVSMILSMIIVFIGVQVVFIIIRHILDAILDLTHLSWLDRIFGAAMGFAGGFLAVAAAVQILIIGLPDWPMVKSSKLVQPVDQLTTKALKLAPVPVRNQVQSLFSRLKGLSDSAPNAQRPASSLPKTPDASSGPAK